MNWGVVSGYILKELTEIIRSRLIIMVYLMPTMIILLFGYGIRMDVTHARCVLIDHDQSPLSYSLIGHFEHSKYFNTTIMQDEQKALHEIKQARLDVMVVIPEGFEKAIRHGTASQIGVFTDAAFPSRGVTIQTYVQGVILNAALNFNPQLSHGMIVMNQRTLFNQAMRDEDAIVPGLIGLVLLVAPAILSALLIVKEKERGTIFNFYASPLTRLEFLLAKLIPAFLLHSVNIFILFGWAIWIFDIPFRGSFTLYWVISEIYVMISLAIGALISVVTKSQIVAVVLTVIVTIIPGFLYSGILMPISSMIGFSRIEAHLFPVMYYNHIIYDTFLVGEGLQATKTMVYALILLGYTGILLTLSTWFLRKEVR